MTKTSAFESATAAVSTVLIADDHAQVRAGVRAVVTEIFPDANIREVSDGKSLLRAAYSSCSTWFAVIGARIGGSEFSALLAELARRRQHLRIIIVSAIDSCHAANRSLDVATVLPVLHRGTDVNHLRAAIAAAVQGIKIGYLRNESGGKSQPALTARQVEVHRLLRQGLSNKLIARALGISVGTVKNHMSSIFKITSNRTQAARLDPGAL